MGEFTLEHGKRYQAKIHLPGFQDMASNDKIIDMLSNYGFTDIEVFGHGRDREGSATWSGETVTGPLDRRIVEISEVVTAPPPAPVPTPAPAPTPVVEPPIAIPDSPPVFEKAEPEKKKIVSSSFEHQEDDE